MNSALNPIRILAADDHALLRKGIAMILANHPDMILVAEASNGREALEQYRVHQPDITLMDLQMPEMNGLDAMIAIRSEFPHARIIMLSTYAGDVQVLRAMKVGARGYLLKTLLDKELLETIRAVHAGKKMLSAEASFELAEYATSEALTPGEIDILQLIAAGKANKQIAECLSITEDTVKGRIQVVNNAQEVIEFVNARPSPLGSYIFSEDQSLTEQILVNWQIPWRVGIPCLQQRPQCPLS